MDKNSPLTPPTPFNLGEGKSAQLFNRALVTLFIVSVLEIPASLLPAPFYFLMIPLNLISIITAIICAVCVLKAKVNTPLAVFLGIVAVYSAVSLYNYTALATTTGDLNNLATCQSYAITNTAFDTCDALYGRQLPQLSDLFK